MDQVPLFVVTTDIYGIVRVQTLNFASPTRQCKLFFLENLWTLRSRTDGLREIFQNQRFLYLLYQ